MSGRLRQALADSLESSAIRAQVQSFLESSVLCRAVAAVNRALVRFDAACAAALASLDQREQDITKVASLAGASGLVTSLERTVRLARAAWFESSIGVLGSKTANAFKAAERAERVGLVMVALTAAAAVHTGGLFLGTVSPTAVDIAVGGGLVVTGVVGIAGRRLLAHALDDRTCRDERSVIQEKRA